VIRTLQALKDIPPGPVMDRQGEVCAASGKPGEPREIEPRRANWLFLISDGGPNPIVPACGAVINLTILGGWGPARILPTGSVDIVGRSGQIAFSVSY